MTVDVYTQYFSAECIFNNRKRNAALVSLTADSENGHITYTASATFFPHDDDEDFAISYDAYVSKIIYDADGRRSKKKEELFLKDFANIIDDISKNIDAKISWEKHLRQARRG